MVWTMSFCVSLTRQRGCHHFLHHHWTNYLDFADHWTATRASFSHWMQVRSAPEVHDPMRNSSGQLPTGERHSGRATGRLWNWCFFVVSSPDTPRCVLLAIAGYLSIIPGAREPRTSPISLSGSGDILELSASKEAERGRKGRLGRRFAADSPLHLFIY
jgi:hypothetical protein